jgi:branched-chain amino acid transport system ATP-binding protein
MSEHSDNEHTTSSSPALVVRGICSGYGHTEVVRDVDLVVAGGAVVALLGPNGAGKTTLLKTISGLIRPTAGTVELFGEDVTTASSVKRTKRGMCHVPEGRGIFRSLTVRENLELQARAGEERLAVERAVAAFPILGERLQQQAGTMSGGQQQMLAMARAYVQKPRLVLVDEASLGLAPVVVDDIFAFLESLTKEGASLLIVDQFVARALELASMAYVLNRGSIAYAGTAAQLRDGDMFERYLGDGAQQVAG